MRILKRSSRLRGRLCWTTKHWNGETHTKIIGIRNIKPIAKILLKQGEHFRQSVQPKKFLFSYAPEVDDSKQRN